MDKQDLIVLDEISKHLFPLRPEEYQCLYASIAQEGVRDPLVVWPRDGQLVLVDGHNRYRIARELGKSFNTVKRYFKDLDDVLDWIDRNQLARRNLTDAQFAVVIGRIYEREKKAATGFADRDLSGAHFEHRKTAEKIAAEFGVGQATVRRAAEFAKAVDAIREKAPAAAEKILRDEVPDALTELPKLAKKPELLEAAAKKLASGEAKNVKEAKRKAEKEIRACAGQDRPAPVAENVSLVLGDFREVLKNFPENSVDLIFTDPPYSRGSLQLYEALAEIAARVLKPGGSLVAYAGQHALPGVLSLMGKHLRYWWLLAVKHENSYSSLSGKKVYVTWKPLLWFVKGAHGGEEFVFDSCQSKTPDKTHHEWAQSIEEALYYIGKLCPPGGLVLDPFAGSGTTLIAAHRLGRKAFGVEVNEENFREAQKRLAEELGGGVCVAL